MKTHHAIGLAAVSVLITVAIEESRIASLRQSHHVVANSAAVQKTSPEVAKTSNEETAAPVRTKNRSEANPEPAKKPDTTDESFAKTARKMWDNPAGKSMMNQGAKMAVAMMYQDFIDGLDLSKEEADYFKNLLGKQIGDQQELGMKMMGATEEERKTLSEELKKRADDSEAEIKKFLNSEEDVKAYESYKNHLPERQQLDGIRSAMSTKGVPLDPETETKLVDAMYRARTEAKAPDTSGPEALDALAKGNFTESFEKSWDVQQEALRNETGKILNPTQMEAFQEYQKQAKEMQMMGLKMAEKMMSGKKEGAN
jgi:hypothetical protein